MFEIVIKKEVINEYPESSSYERISDTGGEDGGVQYGYVKKPGYEKKEMVIVFQQQVESMELLKVVAAFNGVIW